MPQVLLFGEPMALFTAMEEGPLAQAERFTRSLAGAEVNVAIGLRRLGHSVAYATRVGDDPLGEYIAGALEREGIDFDMCPGVSAFGGAAAALNLEYTLPGISQSVIITRMAGRTPVPEREKLSSLASHQTSMVLFLSTGLLRDVERELQEGGYPGDTPAAIVYKATWKEEKKVLCTVDTLAGTAEEMGVKNTALILIGRVLAPEGYERSRLYDPGFTTGFRKGTEV